MAESAETPSKRVRSSDSDAEGDVVSEVNSRSYQSSSPRFALMNNPPWVRNADSLTIQATPQTGEKRKRGRPRKYPEGTFPKPSTDGPKRGRGRPRKILTEEESAAAAAQKEASAAEGPKRGRGRPRKEPGRFLSSLKTKHSED